VPVASTRQRRRHAGGGPPVLFMNDLDIPPLR
jgi:hypothetical protein